MWHGDHWQYDVINQGLDQPIILSPQKLHHVTPQSRIIVIMRDPTLRLISDYKYYVRVGRQVSSKDFHDKVGVEFYKMRIFVIHLRHILTYVLRREAAGVVRPSPGVTAGFGEL